MTTLTQNLLALLQLEQKSEHYFIGQSQTHFGTRVYGGQLLAQSIMAAANLTAKSLHSLHAYFLYTGDATAPILYHTELLRDSPSFSTIQVTALQFGRQIYKAMLSYMQPEDGLEYQTTAPEYPAAEQLQTEQCYKQQLAQHIPAQFRNEFMQAFAIESRPITLSNPFQPQVEDALYCEYLKTHESLSQYLDSNNDVPAIHQAIAAYFSDYNLYTAAFKPHGLSYLSEQIMHASLDHVMYFHRPFRADISILYEMRTTCTAQSRGLNFGQMWQNGKMVCSSIQENLMRQI